MVQISLRVQPVRLNSFQQGEDRDAGVGAGLGIAEQPVLPADNYGADRVFHLVVADFDLAGLLLISISPWSRNAQRYSRWFRE